jgi:hypothetical protein
LESFDHTWGKAEKRQYWTTADYQVMQQLVVWTMLLPYHAKADRAEPEGTKRMIRLHF